MILHFSQMGFTEDLTFISVIHSFLEKSPFTIITERLANCKHIFPEKQGFSALFSVFLTERADFREKSRSGALPKRLLVWQYVIFAVSVIPVSGVGGVAVGLLVFLHVSDGIGSVVIEVTVDSVYLSCSVIRIGNDPMVFRPARIITAV